VGIFTVVVVVVLGIRVKGVFSFSVKSEFGDDRVVASRIG